MAEIKIIAGSDLVKNSRSAINDNFKAVASNFAGTAFPTTNLYVGMTCYRTDKEQLYRYIAENVWTLETDFGSGTNLVAQANSANVAKKLASSVTINGTAFDGSQDITTSKWGAAKNMTIKDSEEANAGASTLVDGNSEIILHLPSSIKANLIGTADKATNADNADVATKLADTLSIEEGGTGTTTASEACVNLGIFNSDGHLVLPNGSEFWIE